MSTISEKNKLKYIELSNPLFFSSDVKLSSNIPYQITIVFPYINVSGYDKYKKLIKFKFKYTTKKYLSLRKNIQKNKFSIKKWKLV